MKVALIYNPTSGKGIKRSTIEQVLEVLRKHKCQIDIYRTEYPEHAIEITENLKDIDLVISMGGDGTFSEVVEGNVKRKSQLVVSHLPIGTTNDVGTMCGYGKNIIQNLEAMLNGKNVDIDICYLNDRPFLYCAGFGKFVKVSYDTPKKLKKKFGYLAYLMSGIKEFIVKTKLYDFVYEVNGEKIMGKYSFFLISNSNRIAGINNFYNDVKLNDGKFEVLFCNLSNKKDIIKGLIGLATKQITKVSGFEVHRTDNLKIISNEKNSLEFSLDGEKYLVESKKIIFSMKKKMKIRMPNKKLSILVEEENED